MSTIRQTIARRPLATGVVAALGAVALSFGIYWFGPQKLFVDQRVSEAAPAAAPEAGEPGAGASKQSGDPVVLARGEFRSLAHDASGTALVLELGDGSQVLRFEDLDVLNGPDLKVYLSTATATSEEDAFDDDYVSLGPLKGNVGDQNYELPRDVDVSEYRSAVVWCERFSVGFAVAPIES
jgi:hypothetical protein